MVIGSGYVLLSEKEAGEKSGFSFRSGESNNGRRKEL
jgi:hypothetical protein